MEDAKSEKSEIMEELVPQDSSSWGEWTIIHDDRDKDLGNEVPGEVSKEVCENDDKEEESHVIEEAREVIEEIDPSTLDSSVVPATPREDDSDGISVITESDKGDESRGEIFKAVEPFGGLSPRFGKYTSFIAACCLAAAIGFGIGCVVGTGKAQLQSSDIPPSPKPSFPRVGESTVDVSGEVSVTVESEPFDPLLDAPNIPDEEPTGHDKLRHLSRVNDQNLSIRKLEQIPTFKNSLDKLKLSLETLCSLVNKNQLVNYENICSRNSRIFEVIELKDTVEYIVNEFGYKEDASMRKFLESIDVKIEEMVTSFLDRLSKIVEKMRGKLYQRICLIRNTYERGTKIQEILDQRLISVDNCRHSPPKGPIPEKKRRVNRSEQPGIHSVSEAADDLKSLEVDESTELHGSHKNKRKDERSEEFRKKKYQSNMKNDSTKFQSSLQAKGSSEERGNFNSSGRVKTQGNNHLKYNKKHKQSRESAENSSEERDFISFEGQGENKNGNGNDFKPAKKYGTPKGEPKENFVEKKHGSKYESGRENSRRGPNEKVCYSKKCSKPHENDERSNRKGNGRNGEWQFERAQGRRKVRSDEEDIYGVWYDDRAKARERARLGF